MKIKLQITVSKLERAEHSGDWHDKPLKWVVSGPGSEVQKFGNRREAEKFASIRRGASDFSNALDLWLRWALARP